MSLLLTGVLSQHPIDPSPLAPSDEDWQAGVVKAQQQEAANVNDVKFCQIKSQTASDGSGWVGF